MQIPTLGPYSFYKDIALPLNPNYVIIYRVDCVFILNGKRNATLTKMVTFLLFDQKHSLGDNAIAKYFQFPCIQYQNQIAVTYGCRTATRILRKPPLLKSQSSETLPFFRKKKL